MATKVAQMSKSELREMIEEKLLGLLEDPDRGLELQESLRLRLLRQKKSVAAGDRGKPLADVVRRLGL